MELSSIDQTLLWNPPVKGDKVKKNMSRARIIPKAPTFVPVDSGGALKELSSVRLEENPLMNVGVVGLQEPRISVTLYKSKTYLLSATQTPT